MTGFSISGISIGPLALREVKGRKIWRNDAIRILINIEHCLHVFERALLAGLARSNHHLAQDIQGEIGIGRLGILDNDLGQNQPGDVFSGSCVHNPHVIAALQNLGHFLQVDITAVRRIVKAAILIFPNKDSLLRHIVVYFTP